jgi:soluble lytic murein transglycosylase-like protein
MKKIALAFILSATPAMAEQSHADYWREEAARQAAKPVASQRTVRSSPERAHVKKIVADEARKQLGDKWVPVALQIAYVESRFNPAAVGPKTRHGRAQGVMQVMPGTARAMGYDPARLRDVHYGASAGVAHMRLCIASGVRTEHQMALCHVSGVGGWKRRLSGRDERYKTKYTALVRNARVY